MTLTRRLLLGLAAAVLPLAGYAQSADTYPDRQVKIVVPYPAGGYYDRVARILADVLKNTFNQPFIVENKVGANGVIGADQISKAAPDGYNLLLAAIGPNAISPAMGQSLPYDPINGFAPISLLVSAPNVLVVPAASSVRSVDDLLALAKRMDGRANYAHNGIGSSVHLAMELLKGATGMKMNSIPYRGSSYAVTAVTAGEVDAAFGSVLDVLPLIQGGRLRAIAIGGTERIGAIPDVKTVAEQGIAGFDSSAWSGLIAPPGTSPAIVAKLNAAVNAALKDPVISKRLSPGGELQMLGGTSKAFGDYIKTEITKWQKVVKDNSIKPE